MVKNWIMYLFSSQFFLLPPTLGAFLVHFDENGYILHFWTISCQFWQKGLFFLFFKHFFDIFLSISTITINYFCFLTLFWHFDKNWSIFSAFDKFKDIFLSMLTKTGTLSSFWPFRVNFDKTGQFSMFFLPSFGPFTLHFWWENKQTLHFWQKIDKHCILGAKIGKNWHLLAVKMSKWEFLFLK